MKSIHVTFEDHEFEALLKAKGDLSWHDFTLALVRFDSDEDDEESELHEMWKDYLSECYEDDSVPDFDTYLERIEQAGLSSAYQRIYGEPEETEGE